MASRKTTRRRRGNGASRKVSLGILLGFVPGVSFAFSQVGQGGDLRQAFERLIMAYTGFYPSERRMTNYWIYGLAPLMGGFAFHWLADAVGINKAISRLKLPVQI